MDNSSQVYNKGRKEGRAAVVRACVRACVRAQPEGKDTTNTYVRVLLEHYVRTYVRVNGPAWTSLRATDEQQHNRKKLKATAGRRRGSLSVLL